MRPSELNALFAGAASLRGVGARLEKALARLVRPQSAEPPSSARVVDLVWHLPTGLVDRSFQPTVAELPNEGVVTVLVTVERHRPPPPRAVRTPYRIECADPTGFLTLVFFHARESYLRQQLPEGEARYVSGRIEWYNGEPQIVHPDHIVEAEAFATLPLKEPVYPLTTGITPKVLRNAIQRAIERLPTLPEWLDESWKARQGWPDFADALRRAHAPLDARDLEPQAPARARLAYDELLANQLALTLMRQRLKRISGRSISGDGRLRDKIKGALPYILTGAQQTAISEILADMAAPDRMLRLLQGDVGAGKTAVALMALATTVEAGLQGAFMVPTELLARQHAETLRPLVEAGGMRLEILTGRETGKTRTQLLERLAEGAIDILVGTHALFQDDVAFRDLGLVVIDEQHRFGVHQRLALQAKAGGRADMLVMTATPIPRSLALTIYGDMDVSRLTEKPAGRTTIDTRVLPLTRIEEVVDAVDRALDRGARVYWVCPLVEDTGLSPFTAAEARHAALSERFSGRVGLVHGRMKGPDKDAAMVRFQSGATQILVATTVIEVGVDVPEATIMVIENAERFGLSQLHQLRGRVGRGSERSTCLLLYQPPLGDTARARLKTIRESDDGFFIAEEDLKLRGAGEVLGVRQSGMPVFRVADIEAHGALLATARDDARLMLDKDQDLSGERGRAARLLLYLFERDEAIRLLRAG